MPMRNRRWGKLLSAAIRFGPEHAIKQTKQRRLPRTRPQKGCGSDQFGSRAGAVIGGAIGKTSKCVMVGAVPGGVAGLIYDRISNVKEKKPAPSSPV